MFVLSNSYLDLSLILFLANRLNRKYYRPARITGFMVVIFESERRFNEAIYKDMVKSFVGAAKDFGELLPSPPMSVISERSLGACRACDRRPCSLRQVGHEQK